MPVPSPVRSYLAEPAIPDPPARVWRDWAVVGLSVTAALLEAALRTDDGWTEVPVGWRIAGLIVFLLTGVPALLVRRTRPLLATVSAFAPMVALGAVQSALTGTFGGLDSVAVVLIVPYALYRWGSGRDGALGALVLLAAGIVGNLSDPASGPSEWIGGFIVLSIPIEAGLTVRYRSTARDRAIEQVRARERETLARELHDTVAHHVSAIAVQAQAGQVLADTQPERAVEILSVIEQAASRTLAEMRAMVGTLRAGADAELTPQQGLDDLRRLAGGHPAGLRVEVDVDDVGELGPGVGSALFRIAQESVTNAARHARRATVVHVSVRPEGDDVRLTVSDDGEPDGGGTGFGFGLLGMVERAQLLGGRCTAGPVAPRGWQVVAELPKAGVTS